VNTLAAAAETFASRLSHVSVTLLVVAVALHVAGLLLRATAWWSVLSAAVPSRRAPWRGVAGAYLAGTGVNNVIPARGGDVARVVLATRAVPGACCPTIASSLLVETLLDTLIGAGLIVWAVSTGALPFALLRTQLPGGSWTLIAAALAVPVALVVAACLVRDRAAAALAEARRGFAILASPRAYLVRVALPQVTAWMLRVLAMYCFLHAFHIDGQMNHAALALLAGSVTTLVPLTPGGVGTQQALLVVLLAGVAAPAAVLSFSLGTQLVITVVNVTLGGACMAFMLGRVPWPMRVPAPVEPAPALVPVAVPAPAVSGD
jgi:uncharacterized membrane protein YbhN (UPF0104 family)